MKDKLKKKYLHRRFYLEKEDIPRDFEGKAIIYETPKPILTINSLVGLNYHAVSKELAVMNLVHQWKIEEALRNEIVSERIRSNILARRMIEQGLSTTLTPEEIKDYSTSMSAALIEDIDSVMERAPRSINDEIFCRVKKELAEVSYDIKSDYGYNVLRLDHQLNYYDKLMADIMSAQDRRVSLKDKAAIIQRISKSQQDAIKLKKEVIGDLGLSLRDIDKSKEAEAISEKGMEEAPISIKSGSLSGALKKDIQPSSNPSVNNLNGIIGKVNG